MKRVKVLIPFHNKDTNVDQVAGDIIEVSDEKLASIKAINVNMVLVLEDVKLKTKETKEVNEVKEVKKTKPKKTTTTKTTK